MSEPRRTGGMTMVTKEQLSNVVAAAKANPRVSVYRPYIVALADENATLRAQLAEAVALFEQERKGSKSWWEAANRLVAQLRGTL